MKEFLIGVYWYGRPLTLRQYADATREFLAHLQTKHLVFGSLEWVGDQPGSAVKLLSNLSNLDDLILQHAWDASMVYTEEDPDGCPTWQSQGVAGFDMWFNTGFSSKEGGVTISISDGMNRSSVENSVTMTFPAPGNPHFPHQEFYNYDFIKQLFLDLIQAWNPDHGLVVSREFYKKVDAHGLPGVGWLTFLRDPRAMALRNDMALKDFIIETANHAGTLVSLDRQLISPDNTEQVEKARFLRNKLIAESLVKV